MDIDYLLALQGLRESLPGFIENLMIAVSFLGDGVALAVAALIVYWCVNKRIGQFAMICSVATLATSHFLKNIVCAYRPWIRDARVMPAASAIEGAGGYSFPSSHTAGSGAVLGSFAWLARTKHPAISAVCVVVVLLIAFSRNFLGVHTPQDVIAGFAIAALMIAFTQAFFNWIDEGDAAASQSNRDLAATIAVLAACTVAIASLMLKPYPMDFANGELLVDPEAMLKGAFQTIGLFAGAMVGWFLERRLVGFTTIGIPLKRRVMRGVTGTAVSLAAYFAADILLKLLLSHNMAKLFSMFALAFAAMFLAPLAFSALERSSRRYRQS